MTRFFPRLRIALFILPLLALGCDSGGEEGDPPPGGGGGGIGTPDVTLTGSAYATVFNRTDAGAPSALSLFHFDGAVAVDDADAYRGDVMIVSLGSTSTTAPALAPGTYEVGSPGLFFLRYGEDLNPMPGADPVLGFAAQSGSVTIEAVTNTEVRGSYLLDFQKLDQSERRVVEGDFVAPVVARVNLTPDPPVGSYTATAAGAVNSTYAGEAEFGYVPPPDGRTVLDFSRTRDSSDPDTTLFVSGIVATDLAVGSYPITDELFPPPGQFGAGLRVDNVTDAADFYSLSEISGSLTIATLTAAEVTGSFSFTGRTLDAAFTDIGETTVTGTFTAPVDP